MPEQQSAVRVQRSQIITQVRRRQVFSEHRPEQQSVPLPQASASSPQTVSQRLLVQRRLQQSVLERQRSPAGRQSTRHTPVNPLVTHVVPRQQGSAPRPQERPGRLHEVDDRQVPAVQLPEQQSRPTVQSIPSLTQVGLGVWQVPAVQVSPAQHPDPHGMPIDAHTTGSWQVPAVQVSPAQQPDPQGIPTVEHAPPARHTPLWQLRPAQHSPLYTHARPAAAQVQVPLRHAEYPQQSRLFRQGIPPPWQQMGEEGEG